MKKVDIPIFISLQDNKQKPKTLAAITAEKFFADILLNLKSKYYTFNPFQNICQK